MLYRSMLPDPSLNADPLRRPCLPARPPLVIIGRTGKPVGLRGRRYLERSPLHNHEMNDTEPTRLRCDGIQYRSGFIETRLVHAKHINLETWSVDPGAMNASTKWVTDVNDSAVNGNVQLELDLRTAVLLADSLHELVAIESAETRTETICDECGSPFMSSQATMSGLCPECSHYLYNKPNCPHSFRDGRCRRCGWDGSVSEYVATIKGTAKSG